jgi:hypothetical protein
MRRELREAVALVFSALPENRAATKPSAHEREWLVSLSGLVTRCRSAVERDGYSRDVELVPDPEAPTRLVVQLERLLAGLSSIGVERSRALELTRKSALDSIPPLRRKALECLWTSKKEDMDTTEIAMRLRYPTNTVRRALEDLAAHEVLERQPGGRGKPDRWCLSDDARGRWHGALAVPDISGTPLTRKVGRCVHEGVPGKSEGS